MKTDNPENENNLSELNKILFKTLRGVTDKTVKKKEADTITRISTVIINNAKVQLQAYRATNGRTELSSLPSAQQTVRIPSQNPQKEKQVSLPLNSYDRQMHYALELGYKTPGAAILDIGKHPFLEGLKEWETKHEKKS